MMKVAKFGGSSVAGAEQFVKVKSIVESDPSRSVVVISACGKRTKEDHKITDLLYLCCAHMKYGVSYGDIFDTIVSRFLQIRDKLSIPYSVEKELEALRNMPESSLYEDFLVSRGEYFTSKLMASFLGYEFCDAAECVFMNSDGKINIEKTYKAIAAKYEKHKKIVIPGFYGVLPNGKIKTMSRGGSDITGSLAAAACNADCYENWTDVSGILMADPRIVENPKPIEKITYSELRELASMGASVLHEDSVFPVKEANIPLNIRNTNRPQDKGTVIVSSIDKEEKAGRRFITGIAGRRNFDIITVSKRNMDINSSLKQVFAVFERTNVKVEHFNLGIDSFSFIVSASSLGDRIYDLISEIKLCLEPDDVNVREHLALVAAVGRKMTFRPGASGTLFSLLGKNNVNIRTIAQDSNELSIVFGVDDSMYETAVRVIYEGFAV